MIIHPCLFLNDDRIEVARSNIARHEWTGRIYHELKLDADRLANMELPKFETAWWQEASKKHWRSTYPEVMHHTYFVPAPAIDLAWKSAVVYSLGGEEKYLEQAKRTLLHYTDFSFDVEHPDTGLNFGIWGMNAVYAYDALYDKFTPAEREKLDDFFCRMVKAVAHSDEWWIEHNPGGKYNNHFAFHKLMMAAYGLFYDRPEWVTRAIESDQGIRQLIEKGLLDDGIWFESSLNYHFTALAGLTMAADMFRVTGYPLDLYTHEFTGGRSLEDAFSGMVEVVFPDTTIPPIGDTYGRVRRLADQGACEYAWVIYGKPLYSWLLSRKTGRLGTISLFREAEPVAGKAPVAQSRTFPQHGYVILRSIEGREYWSSDSWAAFLSYDIDSIHSHRDKLDFILFGRGKLLAPDCEAVSSAEHAFSSKIQSELNRTTICHNTLMVDRKDHRGAPEKLSLLEFKRNPEVKQATAADLKEFACPGVRLQRTVVVTADYVLDVFQAASPDEHDYDWLFHARDDEGRTRIGGEFVPTSLPEGPQWAWLRNARSAGMDDTWQAEWHQGDVRFRLTMLGAPGTEVTLCDFPRNDKLESPAVPMFMVHRKGKAATFIALYQAERHDLTPVEIAATEEDRQVIVSVTIDGTTHRHVVPRIEQRSEEAKPVCPE